WIQRAAGITGVAEGGPAEVEEEGAALGHQMLLHLFTHNLTRVQRPRAGVSQLFLALFIRLNSHSKAVRWEGDEWVRHSMELIGLETLWEMALEDASAAVAHTAGGLLVDLHRQLAPKLRARSTKEVETRFVETCLSLMGESVPIMVQLKKAEERRREVRRGPPPSAVTANAAAAAGEEGRADDAPVDGVIHMRRVGRCIQLLKRFLDWSRARSSRDSAESVKYEVEVWAGRRQLPLMILQLSPSFTVGELRALVGRVVSEPPEGIMLTAHSSGLKLELDSAQIRSTPLIKEHGHVHGQPATPGTSTTAAA
ncbi:unnamed protein product, partial [Chrysoparadoxa australica]